LQNLEDYLETKRIGFPRFYFLSNDELLEILAQAKAAQAVQPHMGKCFDGIRRLDFGDDPKSIDIYAMISGECTTAFCCDIYCMMTVLCETGLLTCMRACTARMWAQTQHTMAISAVPMSPFHTPAVSWHHHVTCTTRR
jgi:hypothetical protein